MTETNLRELQSLLQTTFDKELIVVSYVVKDLLPVGENYGSNIVDVRAVIKRKHDEENEDLFLVAKLPPQTQAQREMFDHTCTFRKEIFMYSKILPFYRQLETDNGIEEEDAFNIGPKFYGARMSLNDEWEFDDDAAILLENLKSKGYYCIDRKIGSDLAHAKCTLKALARFHALGIATKEQNPEFFDTLKANASFTEFKNLEEWIPIIEQRVQDIAQDPEIEQYLNDCVNILRKGSIESWIAVPSEPWSTIIHSDFWANNMMYHRKNQSDSNLDDIKFIDYQNYLFLSPTRELTFFLTTGLDHDTIEHIDELIDLYYNTLIERLEILHCNIEPYSRESFDKKIQEDACIEFAHGFSLVKIITLDVDANDPDSRNIKGLMEFAESNENYRRRLRDFVKAYVTKGWLRNTL